MRIKTFIIADLASAHDVSLSKASDMIHAASDAGCDAVKIQYWSDSARLAARRRVPTYYAAHYDRYQIPVTWLDALCLVAQNDKIEFMCTVFLPEDILTVSPYLRRWKISAFESGAQDLTRAIFEEPQQRPVILSLGGGCDVPHWKLIRHTDTLMHCVSGYPTATQDANLQRIRHLSNAYNCQMGFSDHTALVVSGGYAVAAGASVLEKHLASDHTERGNPDGGTFALRPVQMRKYVKSVRFAESLLGDGAETIQPSERSLAPFRVRNDG